jgi:ankyrin repeat protein
MKKMERHKLDFIFFLIRNGHVNEIRKHLHHDDLNLNCRFLGRDSTFLHTPLTYATSYGMRSIIQLIVEEMDGDLDNIIEKATYTPLIVAIDQNNIYTVKFIVDKLHADINRKDTKGNSPIFHASIIVRNLNMVEYLVERGANLNQPGLLWSAVENVFVFHGESDTIKILRFLARQEYMNLITILEKLKKMQYPYNQRNSNNDPIGTFVIKLLEKERKEKRQRNMKKLLLVYKKATPEIVEDVVKVIAEYM